LCAIAGRPSTRGKQAKKRSDGGRFSVKFDGGHIPTALLFKHGAIVLNAAPVQIPDSSAETV
jgi:hypothetical protein